MPVNDASRRVPVPLKEKLKELESLNIVAKVTDWISSMVIVMKNNKMSTLSNVNH